LMEAFPLGKVAHEVFPGGKGWRAEETAYGACVVPEDDIADHHPDSVTCPCKPRVSIYSGNGVTFDRKVIVHNAFDGREDMEHVAGDN
jgi:hypothetical protein